MVDFIYENQTSGMVVFKCIGEKNFFIERVIFPKEIFTLMAPEGSFIEIWGIESYGPKLEQRMRVGLINSETNVAA